MFKLFRGAMFSVAGLSARFRWATFVLVLLRKGLPKSMEVDKSSKINDNQASVLSCRPQSEFTDTVGVLSARIMDLDALGFEACLPKLGSSSEQCLFVLWYPYRYSPADVARFHKELAANGATLVRKNTPQQSAASCWQEHKAALDQRRVQREAALADGVLQAGTGSAR